MCRLGTRRVFSTCILNECLRKRATVFEGLEICNHKRDRRLHLKLHVKMASRIPAIFLAHHRVRIEWACISFGTIHRTSLVRYTDSTPCRCGCQSECGETRGELSQNGKKRINSKFRFQFKFDCMISLDGVR